MSKSNKQKRHPLHVTSTGFQYRIDQKRLRSYEFLELLSELDEKPQTLPKLVNFILGPQADKLKDHVRGEDGLVDSEKMMSEIKEIFKNKNVKN